MRTGKGAGPGRGRRDRRAIVALAAALASTGALACGDSLPAPKRTAESARYVVAFRTTPAPPPVGAHFVVDLEVCPKPGAKPAKGVRVDAQMPDHRHGMNYRPTVTPRGAGRYRAEGLLFHMPGRWVYSFDVDDGTATERITAEEVLR